MHRESTGDRIDRLEREVAELRRSRRRVVAAADAERRALERAVHDGVQQDLVAVAVNLQRLSRLLERDPVAARALVDQLAGDVRDAVDETAELAQRIYPPLLDARGLPTALRSVAQGLDVTLAIDVPSRASYPPEASAAVYWSCLETLSCAPPGSGASVRVRVAEHALLFEIAIASPVGEDRLERLRDRIEALDGRITVDHPSGGGSRVQGWLALSRLP